MWSYIPGVHISEARGAPRLEREGSLSEGKEGEEKKRGKEKEEREGRKKNKAGYTANP